MGDNANIVNKLPIHGFVLAGGKSTRMGHDKALLRFLGRPMVEIAVEKLRSFCADVSIAGNREDLASYAPVVHEKRLESGPAAGIEAGLQNAIHQWALFIPVDVPLVPEEILRNWCTAVLAKSEAGAVVSFLIVARERQPAFCLWKRDCLQTVTKALNDGQRRLNDLLDGVHNLDWGWAWPVDATRFSSVSAPTATQLEFWFANINTPGDLAGAEAWATTASFPGNSTNPS